jgi:hypothetical protein
MPSQSVKDAGNRADQLMAQLAAAKQQSLTAGQHAVPQASEVSNNTQQPETPASQTPTPSNAPSTEQPATPPAGNASAVDETLEQRFRVLEGKYRAEVPRLAEQLKQATTLNAELRAQLEAATAKSHVTDEDREAYGEDQIEVMKRAARDAVAAELAEKNQRIAQLEAQFQRVAGATTEMTAKQFTDSLTAQVPDWVSVNGDKEFKSWLGHVDPMSGLTRDALLNDAAEKFDVARVVRFFAAFKEQKGSRAKQADSALASQVSPDSSRTPEVQQPKRYWTSSEIAAHYENVRKGKVSAEDAKKLDVEINLAAREGRVRG